MKKRLIISALILLLLTIWLWYGNGAVELNRYEIVSDVPEVFDNFTIAQVSDLHNAELGENNKKVIDTLKRAEADIIVMTGDMIDSRNTKIDITIAFAKEAVKIAPCYYVTGNHEARVSYSGDEYEKFKSAIKDIGVTVLENEYCEVTRGEEKIIIAGLDDMGFDYSTGLDVLLDGALPDGDEYKILLAHRPEYFDIYEGVDLIFSGHAHGGQIRLPFIGGLFAPGQGVLPEYDGGIFEKDGRVMVLSRGLGNSLFPIRVNNKPEVVAVKLIKEDK